MDGFVVSLTVGVVSLMSTTTVSAMEVRADPTWSGDLRKGFASAFTALTGLIVSGDVVVGAATLNAARST